MDQNYSYDSTTVPQYSNFSGYQSAPRFGPGQNQFPPFTNIILVDSLEQALRMPARMHSEMVYWNRYKDEIYRIYTDYSNSKQYMTLDVKMHQQNDKQSQSNSNVDLSAILDKLNNFEKKLEVLNEQYNVNANEQSATNVSTSAK